MKILTFQKEVQWFVRVQVMWDDSEAFSWFWLSQAFTAVKGSLPEETRLPSLGLNSCCEALTIWFSCAGSWLNVRVSSFFLSVIRAKWVNNEICLVKLLHNLMLLSLPWRFLSLVSKFTFAVYTLLWAHFQIIILSYKFLREVAIGLLFSLFVNFASLIYFTSSCLSQYNMIK